KSLTKTATFGLLKELTASRTPEKITSTIILGTPFLTTAKAEIRFDKRTITLKSGKNKINFFKIPESLCRVEEGTESDIDPTTLTTTVSRPDFGMEEINLTKKEMEYINQIKK
ncbi:hypothetical protein Tco_0995406, partial [Tanacetum coccineum]